PLWSPVPGTLTPNPTLGAGRPSLNAQTPTPKPPPTPPPRAHFFTGGRARSAPELVVPLDDRLHAAHDGGGEPGLFHRQQPGDGRAAGGADHVGEVRGGHPVRGALEHRAGAAEYRLGGDPGGELLR